MKHKGIIPKDKEPWLLRSFFLLILLLPSLLSAQSEVNINSFNQVVGLTVDGERVRKLIGNVSLKTEELTMYCDSAYQYLERNEMHAFGNIEIDTPDEQIFADSLIYFTDVDFSQLRGRVIIETDSSTIFSQSVDYRFSTKVGHFLKPVRLEDQDGVLTANTGFYYREPDSAVFRGDVQLADSLQYAEGDSLFINRRTELYHLYGDLFVDDRENSLMLKGDSLRTDSAGHRHLQGNAWLKEFRADTSDTASSDTTHIRSRHIHSVRNVTETDTITVINAYHNVRIWSPKFASLSDTAHYESRDESFELISGPKAWHKQTQLTGPYILAHMQNDEIERLTSYPFPFVVQQDTSLDRLSQIKGDTLVTDFIDGDISRMHVYPNGHLLRFVESEEGEPDGAIDMTATSIIMLFENGEADSLIATGPVDGSRLPESEQTAQRRLDGFTWNPEQRPREPQEPMRRRLPPIPDEPPFELPQRYLDTLSSREDD